MINVVIYNIFKSISDLSKLMIFLILIYFENNTNKIFWVGGFVLGAVLFWILMRFFKKDFLYLNCYRFFNLCYGVSFTSVVMGVFFNAIRSTPSFSVYYTSGVLFIIGIIGKIIFTRVKN